MTLQEAYALAEERGWDREVFFEYVELCDAATDQRTYNQYEDMVVEFHWSNHLSEEEMGVIR